MPSHRRFMENRFGFWNRENKGFMANFMWVESSRSCDENWSQILYVVPVWLILLQ